MLTNDESEEDCQHVSGLVSSRSDWNPSEQIVRSWQATRLIYSPAQPLSVSNGRRDAGYLIATRHRRTCKHFHVVAM